MNMSATEDLKTKNAKDLTDAELLNEFAYANKMSKFYYARKEEIIKEIERRTNND